MRRLLLDRLFVRLPDGAHLTQPHGRFGSWRRITSEQKSRLIDLYLCAAEGMILLGAFGIYRGIFGDSIGFEALFSAAGFAFGVAIFMAQAWLLADAPDVTAPFRRHLDTDSLATTAPLASLFDLAHAGIAIVAFFSGLCVLLAGLMLGETELSVAGVAGIIVAGLLLRREMLRLWRSKR